MKKSSPISSDDQLQQELKKGNYAAFEALFYKYWKRLYAYAYKIYADEKICEDIVQELFITLWERRGTIEVQYLEGYLFKSVKYQIAKYIKRLQWDTRQLAILKETEAFLYKEEPLEYEELEQEFQQQVQNLSPKCKEVFVLSRYQHLSNQEIAQHLNLSIRTVETHISNAIKLLKQRMLPRV